MDEIEERLQASIDLAAAAMGKADALGCAVRAAFLVMGADLQRAWLEAFVREAEKARADALQATISDKYLEGFEMTRAQIMPPTPRG